VVIIFRGTGAAANQAIRVARAARRRTGKLMIPLSHNAGLLPRRSIIRSRDHRVVIGESDLPRQDLAAQ